MGSKNLNNSGHKTEPMSNNTPIQVETSKAPASPTTRTRRVEPSDGHITDNSPTPV